MYVFINDLLLSLSRLQEEMLGGNDVNVAMLREYALLYQQRLYQQENYVDSWSSRRQEDEYFHRYSNEDYIAVHHQREQHAENLVQSMRSLLQ
jgi:hypothetical protein